MPKVLIQNLKAQEKHYIPYCIFFCLKDMHHPEGF